MKNKLILCFIPLLTLVMASCSASDSAKSYRSNINAFKNEVKADDFKNRIKELKDEYVMGDYSLSISKLESTKSNLNDRGGIIVNEIEEIKVNKEITADYESKIIKEDNKSTSKIESTGPSRNKSSNDTGHFIRQYQDSADGYQIAYDEPKTYYNLNSNWEELEKASNPLEILSEFYIANDDDLSYQYYIDGRNNNILTLSFNYYAAVANSLKNEGLKQIEFLENEIKVTTIMRTDQMRKDNNNFILSVENTSYASYSLNFVDQNLSPYSTDGYKESQFIDFGYVDFWRGL